MNASQRTELLNTLKTRFDKHPQRHPGVVWTQIQAQLEASATALLALQRMEASGGEPDVVGQSDGGVYTFIDCAAESPSGRRSLCYDPAALDARKENKPQGSALGMAAAMGIEVLSEAQYRLLQTYGEFDLKTSSWILTPPCIRALGGAVFCDRRYNSVFTYHNGAQSYYAARGYRGCLRV